jgi:4-amino-4-deoxy-L-arabinose transferase-like glycosyltransferase
MDHWMKAILSLAITFVALYLVLEKTEEGHAREVAMWLLGVLMGIGFDEKGLNGPLRSV